MNESELLEKWRSDLPMYDAWGAFVKKSVCQAISDRGWPLNEFLKVQPQYRLKDEESLIDKAFFRADKSYDDPYSEIEDKVGARFVVLLLEHIKGICQIIESIEDWTFDESKHFEKDKDQSPLLFTYQSVHYIVRPTAPIKLNGIDIPINIPCEIQIRTLLQHAHAELTHDAIYKSKKRVKPKVHRTVAKSMALIETTDDFFTQVTYHLNRGPIQEHNIVSRLDDLYTRFVGRSPSNQKSSLTIMDSFEDLFDNNTTDEIESVIFSNSYEFLANRIRSRKQQYSFYQQSVVLFIYWMLIKKRRRLLRDWPLDSAILELLANDIGVSTGE